MRFFMRFSGLLPPRRGAATVRRRRAGSKDFRSQIQPQSGAHTTEVIDDMGAADIDKAVTVDLGSIFDGNRAVLSGRPQP
ncbi:MAG: hypothetical protein FWG09_05690, partial [Synergistaceae bacterium]|nr:hypothetical protein [Synergistaceae bacterium]